MNDRHSVIDKDAQDRIDNSNLLPDGGKTDRQTPPHGEKEPPKVQILVNEHQVEVIGGECKGSQIKQAAIRAGIQIESDFVLSVEYDHGRRKLVGDSEFVQLEDGLRCVAIPDDDNS